MEFRVLRYFLTVAREGNITRAASVLHMTQPTLSRQLAQLEEKLGVQLLVRGRHSVSLTKEGRILWRRAEEITDLVTHTRQEIAHADDCVDGCITMGCGILSSSHLLADLIKQYHQRFPLVTFDLYTGTADEVTERMQDGLIDIGLMSEPVNLEPFEYVRLPIADMWQVFMRGDDPLADKEAVTPEDLLTDKVILPRRLKVKSELANWFGPVYDRLDILFTTNFSTNAIIMVAHGLGRLLGFSAALPYLDKTQFAIRSLVPPLRETSVLAWKRGAAHSEATERFIRLIREQSQS